MSTSVENLCTAVDDEVEAAWEAVVDSREADVSAGKVIPIPFEEAIARLEARFQARPHRPQPYDQKSEPLRVAAGMFLERMRRA